MQPARTAMHAYRNCDSEQALRPDDPAYVDLSEARGQDGSFVDSLSWVVEASVGMEERNTHIWLISGHRGCGKSTELLRFQRRLEEDGWGVVYIDAFAELEQNDLEASDILMTVAEKVAQAGLEMGKGFNDDALQLVYDFFTQEEEVRESARQAEAELGVEGEAKGGWVFVKLLARFRANMKGSESVRHTYRRTVEKRFGNFSQRLDALVREAEDALKANGKRGLVVIVDSLEKLPFTKDKDGISSHRRLFLLNSDMLKSPPCRIFYTMPITLMAEEQISDSYGGEPKIVPMVDLRKPDAREAMCELVRRRIDCEAVFEAGADIEILVDESGGCVRDLLRLCRQAVLGQKEPVPSSRISLAVDYLRKDYDRLFEDADIPRIIECRATRRIDYDETGRKLLYRRVILEYENGKRWMAPHPAVAQNERILNYRPKPDDAGDTPLPDA